MVESVSEQGGYSVQGRTPEAVEFVYYVHHGVGKLESGEGPNRWHVYFARARLGLALSRPHRTDFELTYAGSVARTDSSGHPTDLSLLSHRPGQGVCFESTGADASKILFPSNFQLQGTRHKAQGSIKAQGSGLKAQGSRHKAQGSRVT